MPYVKQVLGMSKCVIKQGTLELNIVEVCGSIDVHNKKFLQYHTVYSRPGDRTLIKGLLLSLYAPWRASCIYP